MVSPSPSNAAAGNTNGPIGIAAGRRHERVGDQDGEIEPTQLARLLLGSYEFLDIGMIAAQSAHHGTAPDAG
jgi:hypothetical protein